jgi:hypothetical protein
MTAFLTRVRTVLPEIIKKEMESALGGKLNNKGQKPPVKRLIPSNQPGSRKVTPGAKSVDWSKTTDADYVAGRITYKK